MIEVKPMSEEEAIRFEGQIGIVPTRLRSQRKNPVYRAWLPKNFTGRF